MNQTPASEVGGESVTTLPPWPQTVTFENLLSVGLLPVQSLSRIWLDFILSSIQGPVCVNRDKLLEKTFLKESIYLGIYSFNNVKFFIQI